ncbi:MAG TPA: ferritin-like domain-containing protein [Pirellulales bacterium]
MSAPRKQAVLSSTSLNVDGTRRPWRSHQWCRYFRRNATQLLEIPWGPDAGITTIECETIADSVREFQLGESAEGRHFVRAAKGYAARSGDSEYVEAVRLLIGEEQRHARELARFLELAQVPLAEATWADTAFRWLRKRAGLEICVSVLLTAEIIAKVYYDALGQATHSPILQTICTQILRDEIEHVRFQSERLALLRAARPRPLVVMQHLAHRALFGIACLVVWRKHARVFRAAGYGFRRFWQSGWQEMRVALYHMTPVRAAARRTFGAPISAAKS